MQVETFSYREESGWSIPTLPNIDSERTLVVVFGARRYADETAAVDFLAQAYPRSVMMGCSSAGEILGDCIYDESLVVAVARFDRTDLRSTTATIRRPEDSFEVGRQLGEELSRDRLRGVFLLSDGLNVNGTELTRGLNSSIPSDIVITGGLAGDGDRFEKTWVLADRKPREGVVSAVGFYSDHFVMDHGSKGGWDIFGHVRTVTKSKGNVLYELDGKPALDLYKEYLGERASGLPATGLLFPLEIWTDEDAGKRLVRTILAVDEESQSLTFAGDVPQGWKAQLMKANFDRLIGGAMNAAEMIRCQELEGSPLAIAISCVGRRLVLAERSEEEVEATLEVFPKGTKQIGFYSYGEISPHGVGSCDLHNQTMTLTAFYEPTLHEVPSSPSA